MTGLTVDGAGSGHASRTRKAILAAGLLLFGGGGALFVVAATSADPSAGSLRYGVSRTDGPAGVAIHWVLCEGQAADIVDMQGYQGGSVGPNGVPIGWQIRALEPNGGEARVERFVVGETPPGYYETVPLRRNTGGATIAINGPPGGPSSMTGMSFEVETLEASSIYRGTYEHVDPERFAREGLASCPARVPRAAQGIGLAMLAIGVAALLRRRSLGFWVALAVAASGVAGSVRAATQPAAPTGMPQTEHRQSPGAFAPGRAALPPGARVVTVISAETTRDAGGVYIARILVAGAYSFAIDCDGPSIVIGEGAEIPNGGTGSRQLIGCATGQLVRGGIADRHDRSELVELVVDPHGAASWQVVVVQLRGEVGPFPG